MMTPPDEDRLVRHARRMQHFGARLQEQGFVAAVVAHPRDLYYLCGTAQPCNLLVVPGAEPTLFARRFGRLVREQAAVSDVVDDASAAAIADRLRALGIRSGTVGVAMDVIPAGLCRKLGRSLAGFELGDYSPALLAQRAVKDAHEIALIRHAGDMFHAAHAAICATARPGVAENEVSAEVARALRREGHDGQVFYRRWDATLQPEGLLASGPNLATISGHAITITGIGMSDALPFGASRRVLAAGDLIVIDVGLNRHGYHADMARTYAVGEPPPGAMDLMDAMTTVFEACCLAALPGTPAGAVYDEAVERCRALGVDQWFQGYGADRGRYVGHGVGVELDEPPVLAEGVTTPLEAGMTIALEPKVIAPEFGGVDLEETVLITEHGGQPLSDVPRRLFVVDG